MILHAIFATPPDNSSAVNVSVVEEHEFEVAACQVRNALTTGKHHYAFFTCVHSHAHVSYL